MGGSFDEKRLDSAGPITPQRPVHSGHIIQFDGKPYEITPTARKTVTVLFHPFRQFWGLDHMPKFKWPTILGHFTL